MKTLIVALAFLISFTTGHAQIDTATLKKNVYARMDSMIILFKNKDWVRYSDFMHPKVVELVGGKDAFSEMLEGMMEEIEAEIVAFKPGKILQIIKTGNGYQGIVESFLQMNVRGGMASGSSYDVIMSEDGQQWNFTRIDDLEKLKQLLTDLSPELKFPRQSMVPGITLDDYMKTHEIRYY